MPRRIGLLIITVALVLSGCVQKAQQKRERFEAIPVAVDVPWLKYVVLPDRLTDELPVERPANDSCGEAIRVARVRRATLDRANCDRAQARALGLSAPLPECANE
jgi:hypothetical protein